MTAQPVQATAAGNVGAGEYVEGFLVPANMRYHPGHGWAQRERSA